MGVLPAYSVTSLHFEHSVAPGAEKVFAGHILQLKAQENTIKLDSKGQKSIPLIMYVFW